ncbi:TetR family transcriptional regulator [Leptobacterium flavescens]|uniref:TetR family transcriptional regulator n=1 Tax=Leptobacterium flavescens TaxID=472055 RepID=A0A6P0UNC0_9FLAO|nr:TetR/AcrR family transcriptional regulator [Leptobacterium flavescens]NER13339.1 TetR family transcriptional regulator [Leptobacterium flavescens]
MLTKAERTSQFIIETVAPIFNRKGYAATSLSDLTEATGMTKGAIYGNFKNKEELALAALNHNIRKLVKKVEDQISTTQSPVQKLFIITNFYRFYNDYTRDFGGCPVLNIGIDASNQHEILMERVRYVISKLQKSISDIIDDGKARNEIKPTVNSEAYARRIFAMIEGAAFVSHTMQDNQYMKEMMNHIDQMILQELKK